MTMAPADRLAWDATTMLEALGAADAALWWWEPERDRLRLNGASRALGLGPLAPEAASAAVRALVLPQDRAAAEDMLRGREPGSEISARPRMRCGAASGLKRACARPVWSPARCASPPPSATALPGCWTAAASSSEPARNSP